MDRIYKTVISKVFSPRYRCLPVKRITPAALPQTPASEDFSVQPLCSLCLCGVFLLGIHQPQRHREHRGCTEKSVPCLRRTHPLQRGGTDGKSPWFEISLCNLCVLCVSVVCFCSEFINHRDTENTEVAQRRAPFGLLGQSRTDVSNYGCAVLLWQFWTSVDYSQFRERGGLVGSETRERYEF